MLRSKLFRLLISFWHRQLWRSFSIPSHLTDRERYTLFKLAKKCTVAFSDNIVAVEIGSYLGASACCFVAGLRETDTLFCIDTWSNNAMSEGQRDTFAEFEFNTSIFGDRIKPLRGLSTSKDVIDKLMTHAKGIHFIFIDGDHSYRAVLADWRSYQPYLVPGAFVVMHDVGWAEGVSRVIEQEIRPRVETEQRLPNLWWGRLKR